MVGTLKKYSVKSGGIIKLLLFSVQIVIGSARETYISKSTADIASDLINGRYFKGNFAIQHLVLLFLNSSCHKAMDRA
jgi:hypothetical protein